MIDPCLPAYPRDVLHLLSGEVRAELPSLLSAALLPLLVIKPREVAVDSAVAVEAQRHDGHADKTLGSHHSARDLDPGV